MNGRGGGFNSPATMIIMPPMSIPMAMSTVMATMSTILPVRRVPLFSEVRVMPQVRLSVHREKRNRIPSRAVTRQGKNIPADPRYAEGLSGF